MIFLTDLMHRGHELPLEDHEWSTLLGLISRLNVVDAETLARWDGATRVDVPKDVARKIGTRLEQLFFDDVRESMEQPVIPDYIRPIATTNGLWIDPALPLLHRADLEDYSYLQFAGFFQTCQGFSIG